MVSQMHHSPEARLLMWGFKMKVLLLYPALGAGHLSRQHWKNLHLQADLAVSYSSYSVLC